MPFTFATDAHPILARTGLANEAPRKGIPEEYLGVNTLSWQAPIRRRRGTGCSRLDEEEHADNDKDDSNDDYQIQERVEGEQPETCGVSDLEMEDVGHIGDQNRRAGHHKDDTE